jgi:Holliday junction DNA helicase RuvA
VYEYFRGTLIQKKPTSLILEVQGVAYFLQISLQTYEKLPAKGEIQIYTYLDVKQDALRLFGFQETSERQMFLLLISVSGIGPITAMTILSSSSLHQLKEAIETEDLRLLKQVKGIGQKTAQRVVIELKDKMADLVLHTQNVLSPLEREAVLALTSLGLTRGNAEKTIRHLLSTSGELPLSELIRQALQLVGKS